MQVKTVAVAHHFVSPLNPIFRPRLFTHAPRFHCYFPPSKLCVFTPRNPHSRFLTACIGPNQELVDDDQGFSSENGSTGAPLSFSQEEEQVVEVKREDLANQSVWNQMKEILLFSGPATGIWISGPLLSLIDTAVIGQGSSIELAALGPGTVFCEYMSYILMFLSVATSNMVATSLARQDKNEVQHHISILLFVGLASGILMLLFTKFFGLWALTAFTGAKNVHILPAANTYVQIRGLAWPAILIGWVTRGASLGMKDSWGPLKALAVASVVNGIGDIVLCRFLDYGIAGVAWASTVSKVVAAYMMMDTLNKKGFNAFAVSVPSLNDLLEIFGLAAPMSVITMSKMAFYTIITYFATSIGMHTLAAHQVMIQSFMMCTVWGEPLSQTAQSFMPEFIYGINQNLAKAQMLLKSLLIFGVILGLSLGIVGTSVPWLFPNIFTPDQAIIKEMHKVLLPFFSALAVTPCVMCLEGTLLAKRDLKFLSLSMSGCFTLGALLLLLVSSRGYGLPGCWFGLVGFQWARFFLALLRLRSPAGILSSENTSPHKLEKLSPA